MTDNLRRVTIPNPQVKDAADQYCEAAFLLSQQPPGSGVLLPFLTTATFALELYLKSLNAEDVYHPLDSSVYLVTAQSTERGHHLTRLFNSLDTELQDSLAAAFQQSELSASYSRLEGLLDRYNTLFVDSRYPFERTGILDNLRLDHLIGLVELLHDFVQNLPRSARIQPI